MYGLSEKSYKVLKHLISNIVRVLRVTRQPGDIILFLKQYQDVGIVTEERDYDGTPIVIHNNRPEIAKGRFSWFGDYELIYYRWKY